MAAAPRPPAVPPHLTGVQQIRFCRSSNGVRLAHARHGNGPPLIVVACWLSHLQYDWQSPVWRHFLEDLGSFTTLIRYDLRGHGLSDWEVDDFAAERHLEDLEAVVEAQGLPRFALMGMSAYSPIALAYAARHPDRVTRLLLYGGHAGWPPLRTEEERDAEAAWQAILKAGWAQSDPTFRRVFTTRFIPGADEDQMTWIDDLQRMSTSTENVMAARAGRHGFDVLEELGRIIAPTLILHAVGDRINGFEDAREIARSVPNARLVPLESRNHILLADEPAWQVFVDETRAFMAPDRRLPAHDGSSGGLQALTGRELEIVGLAADGQTNDEIAATLGLSPRTVERHLSNVYVKLQLSGKAARTAAVGMLLRRDH